MSALSVLGEGALDPSAFAVRVWRNYVTQKCISKFKASPPKGQRVCLADMTTPGLYAVGEHGYVRIEDGLKRETCDFVAFRRFVRSGRNEVLFTLSLPPEHAAYGMVCLYVNNTSWGVFRPPIDTRYKLPSFLQFGEGWTDDFVNTVFGEVCNINNTQYDGGYPSGAYMYTMWENAVGDLSAEEPNWKSYKHDERVYSEFCNAMTEVATSPRIPRQRCGRTKKVGMGTPASFGATIAYRNMPPYGTEYERVKTSLETGHVGVGMLPKIGHLKSNGKLRTVFPMSPTLQIGLERVIGLRDVSHEGFTVVKGAKFSRLKYTYDIENCDEKLGYYLHRWCEEFAPDLLPLLFPPIYCGAGKRYSPRFLSGLFGTSYFVTAFCVAICRSAGVRKGEVQGDGLALSEAITHPYLRRMPDYTINGFYYGDVEGAPPQYINGWERLTSPRLVRHGKLTGDVGWNFRREIYRRFLNCKALPPPKEEVSNFQDLDNSALFRLCIRHKECLRKLSYVGLAPPPDESDRGAHWDYTDTKCVQISKSNFINVRSLPLIEQLVKHPSPASEDMAMSSEESPRIVSGLGLEAPPGATGTGGGTHA